MKAVTDKTKAGWAIRPRFQRSFHLLPFCYDRKTPRFSKRSKTHHRRTNTVVETKDDVLEKIASFRMPDRDIEVDVQTNIWCPWFELELIGTLTGKDADVASRLAIYQEYYLYRGRLQYAIVDQLKTVDPCPISEDRIEMIETLKIKGDENAVAKVLSVLEDWLKICIHLFGTDTTIQILSNAIEESYREAMNITSGVESGLMKVTKSICMEEMQNKIVELDPKSSKPEPSNHNALTVEDRSDLSLNLRESIHRFCLRATMDAVTQFAERDPNIPTPRFGSIVHTTGSINASNRKEFYNLKFSLRCRGSAVEKLRKQMREKRDITKYLYGVGDPFENEEEYSVFRDVAIIYDHLIKIPQPDVIRIGIRSDASLPVSSDFEPSFGSQKFKGFSSKLLRRIKDDEAQWICREMNEMEMNGFLLGMSEFLCDDFGLKSMTEASKSIRYPTENPLRLCWSPEKTHLECVVDGKLFEKPLTQSMLLELRNICDVILSRSDAFITLKPPLPVYVLDPACHPKRKNAGWWFLFSGFVLLIAFLGIFTRTESQQFLLKAKQWTQTRITEVIEHSRTRR